MIWTFNLEKAQLQARTESKSKRYPPDWLRCSYFNENGERCTKQSEHTDAHKSKDEE